MFDPTSFEKKDHIQDEFSSLIGEVAEKSNSMSCDIGEEKLVDKLENSFVPVAWPSVGFCF